jgi:hypothetical protein
MSEAARASTQRERRAVSAATVHGGTTSAPQRPPTQPMPAAAAAAAAAVTGGGAPRSQPHEPGPSGPADPEPDPVPLLHNPLLTPLPSTARSLRMYCLYGVGVPTERAYHYVRPHLAQAAAAASAAAGVGASSHAASEHLASAPLDQASGAEGCRTKVDAGVLGAPDSSYAGGPRLGQKSFRHPFLLACHVVH